MNASGEMDVPDHVAASWIDVSASALRNNLRTLRSVAGAARVAPVVKANAYGHGLELVARELESAGADWLCVNELGEVARLRRAGVTVPVYVLGPTFEHDADAVAALGCHIVCSRVEVLHAFAAAGTRHGVTIPIHLKVETGTNRQGVAVEQVADFVRIAARLDGVRLAGITTHLSSVEDETEHSFAVVQLARFREACAYVPPGTIRHVAASAADLLVPDAVFDLVRPGIAIYGIWPSLETRIATQLVHGDAIQLEPVMRWRTRIVQSKWAEPGAWVGYGRTVRLARRTRLGLLPVGYYDGYDRGLSGIGHVAVAGQLAPVLGRVAMNMTVVDTTHLARADVGDEVTLLGPDADATSAEHLASLLGSIAYEVTTRIEARIPRIRVE